MQIIPYHRAFLLRVHQRWLLRRNLRFRIPRKIEQEMSSLVQYFNCFKISSIQDTHSPFPVAGVRVENPIAVVRRTLNDLILQKLTQVPSNHTWASNGHFLTFDGG